MNLAFCKFLALALTGTDDQTPAKAPGPNLSSGLKTEDKSASPDGRPQKELWRMSLRQARRIALDNSESVRVIFNGEQNEVHIVGCFTSSEEEKQRLENFNRRRTQAEVSSLLVEPVKANVNICAFKSEVKTLVRSVEQQYWTLAQAHHALFAFEQAVLTTQHVLYVEQADLSCRKDLSDLTDAAKRLEQFQKAVVVRKGDAEKAERQLRKLLGLPDSDKRQIIPVDEPFKEHVVLDWNSSHDDTQTTRSLARAALEVDSGYKHYAKAKRLRTAAQQRLEAHRTYWKEGRITADRYLDAVEQYATLVANEHHHLAGYNSALAFVSECKGTLLEDHNIIVAEPGRIAHPAPARASE